MIHVVACSCILSVQVKEPFGQIHDHQFVINIKLYNQVIGGGHHDLATVAVNDKDSVLGLLIHIGDLSHPAAVAVTQLKANEEIQRVAVGIGIDALLLIITLEGIDVTVHQARRFFLVLDAIDGQ